MNSDTQPPKTCVVVDTSVWRSHLLLRDSMGSALLYFVRRCNAIIALPEIVEMEVVKQTILASQKSIESIEKGFRELALVTGFTPSVSLPDIAAIQASIRNRLTELESFLLRWPLNLEAFQKALGRVLDESPPNGPKNQQYKDSLIWEAVLAISSNHRVLFVTQDKAFFLGGDPKQGAAPNLRDDCKRCANEVLILYGIEQLLAVVGQETPPLNKAELSAILTTTLVARLSEVAAQHRFALGVIAASSISVYYTENPDQLALVFELSYHLSDLNEQPDREEVSLTVKGECSYKHLERLPHEVRIEKEELKWRDVHGEQVRRNATVFAGTVNIVLGARPPVPHTVRQPLP